MNELKMSSDKPFRTIHELVAALTAAEQGLVSGTLGQEGLEVACSDARDLYERLIVLRHKARESTVVFHPRAAAEGIPAVVPQAEGVKEPPPATAAEPRPVRLDTRPVMDAAPRQTSLIEAIANTEQERATVSPSDTRTTEVPQKVTEAQAASKQQPSLAEKLEKAALGDLGKAISLSHKFWFVAELFNGDRIAYEKSIEKLNSFGGAAEAQAYLEKEVLAKLKKPADPEALTTFTELVQRRYA